MENRWSSSGKYSQDSQHLASSNRLENFMKEQRCDPEQFKGRIVFISRSFVILLGLGSEKKWYGTYSDKPDVVRDDSAEKK